MGHFLQDSVFYKRQGRVPHTTGNLINLVAET